MPVRSTTRAPSTCRTPPIVYILHLSFLLDLFSFFSNPLPTFFPNYCPVSIKPSFLTSQSHLATMKLVFLTLLVTAAVALAGLTTVSEPELSDIKKAQATTLPEVTTSNVKGLVFDRFFQVWLENIVGGDLDTSEHAHR